MPEKVEKGDGAKAIWAMLKLTVMCFLTEGLLPTSYINLVNHMLTSSNKLTDLKSVDFEIKFLDYRFLINI